MGAPAPAAIMTHDRPVNEPLSRAGYVQKASIDGDPKRLLLAFPGYGRQPATTMEAAVRGSRAHAQWSQEMGVWVHPGVFAGDRPMVFISARSGNVNLPAIGYFPTLAGGFGPMIAPADTPPAYDETSPVIIAWHPSGRAVAFMGAMGFPDAAAGETINVYKFIPGQGLGEQYPSMDFDTAGLLYGYPQSIDGQPRDLIFDTVSDPDDAESDFLLVMGPKKGGTTRSHGLYQFRFHINGDGVDYSPTTLDVDPGYGGTDYWHEYPGPYLRTGVGAEWDRYITSAAIIPKGWGGGTGGNRLVFIYDGPLANNAVGYMGLWTPNVWDYTGPLGSQSLLDYVFEPDLVSGTIVRWGFNPLPGAESFFAFGTGGAPYLFVSLHPFDPGLRELPLSDTLTTAPLDIQWHPDGVHFVVVSDDVAIWRIIEPTPGDYEAEKIATVSLVHITNAKAAAFDLHAGNMLVVLGENAGDTYAELFSFDAVAGVSAAPIDFVGPFSPEVAFRASVAWKPPSSGAA